MGKMATRDNGTNRQFQTSDISKQKEGDRVEFFMIDM